MRRCHVIDLLQLWLAHPESGAPNVTLGRGCVSCGFLCRPDDVNELGKVRNEMCKALHCMA